MLTKGAKNTLLKISSTNVLDSIVDITLQIINLNFQSKKNNCKKNFDLYKNYNIITNKFIKVMKNIFSNMKLITTS